jgi:hypothetical protein
LGCRPPRLLTSPSRFLAAADVTKAELANPELEAAPAELDPASFGLFAARPFQLVSTGIPFPPTPPPRGRPTIPNLLLFPEIDANGFPFPIPTRPFPSSPKSDPPSPSAPFESSPPNDVLETPEFELVVPFPGIVSADFIVPLQTLQTNMKVGWVNLFSRMYDSLASMSH